MSPARVRTRGLRSVVLACLACVVATTTAIGQEATPVQEKNSALKVFVDCASGCDDDFLRSEIAVVSYVRDRVDADVHVLVTTQTTATSGLEFTAAFIGAGRFQGSNLTLKYTSPPSATADEQRRGVAEMLKRGLVPYIADTPLADRVRISFEDVATVVPTDVNARDPWNLWAFRTTLGGSVGGEELSTNRALRGSASANRTTDRWKFTLATNVNYREDAFTLDETTSFRTVTRTLNSSVVVVKSLTDRWSLGIVGNASSSTFLNYELRSRIAPGIEYNIFPYSESTRRLLTVQYTLGHNSFDYREETIFGKTSERLLDHRLGTLFSMEQPWGSASAEVAFAQFLKLPEHYKIGAFGEANIRLFRGFSFNTFATISRTRDQIYLPKAGATIEEILVRQRQLATSYQYSLNLGFAYSFGSIFNNVVNPRFSGGGGDTSIF
jgi:hypothetical protein